MRGGGGSGGLRKYFFDKTTGNLGLLLYPKKFQTKWSFTLGISKTCAALLGNSNAYIKDSWKFHMIVSWSPLYIPFLGPWNFHILFRNSMSSVTSLPTCIYVLFSERAHSPSSTDNYISSFWWVVNILLQKFDTLSKKEVLMQKAAFLSLLWTHPIDLWCNMFETLEIQRKYRW